MVEEHGRLSGHQSEPTTPPEYRETTTGFPGAFSRPNANRYSLSSLQSPPGMLNRSARSGSILTSPQSGLSLSRVAFDDQLPPWSQQTSRRNSDEDEKEEAVRQDPTSHRSTNAYVDRFLSGISMPLLFGVKTVCCSKAATPLPVDLRLVRTQRRSNVKVDEYRAAGMASSYPVVVLAAEPSGSQRLICTGKIQERESTGLIHRFVK